MSQQTISGVIHNAMGRRSTRIYLGLVVVLAVLAAVNVYLPQSTTEFAGTPPASPSVLALVSAVTMLVLYGGLGLVGLALSRRLGFPELWDESVSNAGRFAVPVGAGTVLGVVFIAVDAVASDLHSLGPLPHPPFPTSLVASATASIGEEIVFRLFLVPLVVWLVSMKLLRGRRRTTAFWIATAVSAVAFTFAHLPSVMFLVGTRSLGEVPMILLGELFVLNGLLSVVAVVLFRRYGFLAAVGVHFWTDIVWHVVYGTL